MNLNPVILAIPMYFTLMAVELVVEGITRHKTYRLNDAVTNISTGTLQQVTGTFFRIIQVGIYVFIYEQLALLHIEANGLSFAALFILWDFCYYWEHRAAHSINLFWGGHVVHHQSEDYNLSVALRQSSTAFIWGFPFYLPLAFMGFDPVHFVLVGGFNLLYQFWIHTEHIGKLPGWIEAVFNTPSHHRVHHGRDPKYIDKNYAGVFIIWDRLFGTFQAEEERPHYGITKPLRSWNPVYANFAHYIDLWGWLRQVHSVKDAIQLLVRKPGWLPDYMGGYQAPQAVPPAYQKYTTSIPLSLNLYILIQFIAALLINTLFFFKNTDFAFSVKAGFAGWIVLTTLLFGFMFEKRSRWVAALEILRLLCIPLGLLVLAGAGIALPGLAIGAAWMFCLISLFALAKLYKAPGKQPGPL